MLFFFTISKNSGGGSFKTTIEKQYLLELRYENALLQLLKK